MRKHRCDYCNNYSRDDKYYQYVLNEDDGTLSLTLCSDCQSNINIFKFYLNKRHDNKIFKYVNNKNNTNKTLYGIELEFEHRNNIPTFQIYTIDKDSRNYIGRYYDVEKNTILYLFAKIGIKALEKIICNIYVDGSLSDNSNEFVFYPRAFEWFKKSNNFKIITEVLRKFGYTDGTEAGLHISFNINSVGRDNLYNIMKFLLDNKEKCEKISMRRNYFYARFNEQDMLNFPSENKYLVLSVRDTKRAELRLFKGTLRYDRILRAIEFIDSLINMYRDNFQSDTDFDKYVDYLYLNKDKYSYIINFLQEIRLTVS